jgi:hypothetical protein
MSLRAAYNITLGRLPGNRKHLAAGNYQGRIGRQLNGIGSIVTIPDFSTYSKSADDAIAQGQEYWGQGQNALDLINQVPALAQAGTEWLANSYNQFVSMGFDPSMIDWGNLATKGLTLALDYLTDKLQVDPIKVISQGAYAPGTVVTGQQVLDLFQQSMQQSTAYMLEQQKAEAALLMIIQAERDKERDAVDAIVSTPHSVEPSLPALARVFSADYSPTHPNKFVDASGKTIWVADIAANKLKQTSDLHFIQRVPAQVQPVVVPTSTPDAMSAPTAVSVPKQKQETIPRQTRRIEPRQPPRAVILSILAAAGIAAYMTFWG